MPGEIVDAALAAEILEGTVVADATGARDCIFLAWLHTTERQLADTIRALAAGVPPWPAIDVERALEWAERKLDLALAPTCGVKCT